MNNYNRDMWNHYNNDSFKNYVNVNNLVTEGLTVNNPTVKYTSGGLIGFRWTNVIAEINNLIIRQDAEGNDNIVNGSARTGGMFAEVTGRLDMENINISGLKYNMTGVGNNHYPGLISSEGRTLYAPHKTGKEMDEGIAAGSAYSAFQSGYVRA